MKQRKIPMRKCVASQEMKPKQELYRIVRTKDGEVSVDLTGKKSGRGAYLSKDEQVILQAKQKKVLEKQLETTIDSKLYDELLEQVKKEK